MTLEPETAALDSDENPELKDFRRRFFWTLPLTVIVTVLAMAGHRVHWPNAAMESWIELALSLPIVLWAGKPFFVRAVQSMIHRSPNMWTLIGLRYLRRFSLQRHCHASSERVSRILRRDGSSTGLF